MAARPLDASATGKAPLTAFRAPAGLLDRIERAMAITGQSKSEVIRASIERGLSVLVADVLAAAEGWR